MKVVANLSACQGHRRCVETCPEVFTTDDELGKVVVLRESIPAELADKVHDAVDACPEMALSVVDA